MAPGCLAWESVLVSVGAMFWEARLHISESELSWDSSRSESRKSRAGEGPEGPCLEQVNVTRQRRREAEGGRERCQRSSLHFPPAPLAVRYNSFSFPEGLLGNCLHGKTSH